MKPFLTGCFGALLLLTSSCEKETTKGTVTDFDSNIYHTVKIGDQWWMAENIKTTKYSNGDIITSGIHVQGNDNNNLDVYGRLYSWNVAVDSRNICPTGWHVPSIDEWNILLSHVATPADLKKSGYTHWLAPNTNATNSVLFTALPGGYFDEADGGLQTTAAFWLKNEVDATHGKGFLLYHNNTPTTGDYSHTLKTVGFSVRCIRD